MSTLSTLEADAVKYGPSALKAIGVALAIIGVGGEATAVLAAVEAALTTLSTGAASGADPAAISADLAKLAPDLAADDAAADAAVGKRWPSP